MAAYGESNGAETSGVNSQPQDANKCSISSKSSSCTWSNQSGSALSNPSRSISSKVAEAPGQIKEAALCQIQATTLGQIKVAALCQIQDTWSNQSNNTLSNPSSQSSTLPKKKYFAFISVNQVKDVGVADTNQLKSSSKGCWSLSYKPTQVLVTSSQLALNSCLSKLTFAFYTQCQLAGGILETHPSC